MKHVLVALCLGCLLFAAGAAPAATVTPDGLSPLLVRPAGGKATWLAQIGGLPGGRDKRKEATPEEPAPAGAERPLNPRKMMLYSLLLPGLGQQVAGKAERARVFYGVEAAIWTAWAVNRHEGGARKDRFIEFAGFAGGVTSGDRDDDYWRTIAQYERSDPGPSSANEYVRRQARALYPGDLGAQQEYLQQHGYFGDRAWDWQNADNLARYRQLRSQSLDSYHRAQYSIGLAIVHRLISMVDAVRVAGRVNRARAAAGERGATEPRGRFGLALLDDGKHRVPVLTYRMSF